MRPRPDSRTRGPTPLRKISSQIGAYMTFSDAVEGGLAALGIDLGGLLLEEPVEVGVGAGAGRRHEALDGEGRELGRVARLSAGRPPCQPDRAS
jgi:hypothetical protein